MNSTSFLQDLETAIRDGIGICVYCGRHNFNGYPIRIDAEGEGYTLVMEHLYWYDSEKKSWSKSEMRIRGSSIDALELYPERF